MKSKIFTVSTLVLLYFNGASGQDPPREKYFNYDLKKVMTCDSSVEMFAITEVMPEFPGGKQELNKFIQSNKGKCDLSGKVYVTFIINPDGSIHCVKVVRGLSEICDKEAIDIVKTMPNWKPGMQRKEPVQVQFTLPIEY